MKKIILLYMALLYANCLFAQTPDLPMVDGKICYTEVVKVDSTLTKSDLYANARQWFATAYKSANNVIQMDDKEKGIIIGKAIMPVTVTVIGSKYNAGDIHYTMSIYVKDGRFKYSITDFYHEATQNMSSSQTFGDCENMLMPAKKYKKSCDEILEQLNINALALVTDLKQNMKTSVSEEDW